jgi:hypothetical protein
MATSKKPAQAGVGHNQPPRDLDVIAGDIRAKERSSVFDIGELLIEAQATCKVEKIKWADWIAQEFGDWGSHDTARNYMRAARLARKYELIRTLRLPLVTINMLAQWMDATGNKVSAYIDALAVATTDRQKTISVAQAKEVIDLAYYRINYGDYSPAALKAMHELEVDDRPWSKAAIKAIKAAKPETEEEVERIELTAHHAYVEKLYDSKLPDWLDDEMLQSLEHALNPDRFDDEDIKKARARLPQVLNDAPEPLNQDRIDDLLMGEDDNNDDDEAESKGEGDESKKGEGDDESKSKGDDESKGKGGAESKGKGGERERRRQEQFEDKLTYLEQACELANEVIEVPHLDRAAADVFLVRLEIAINNLLKFKEKINKSCALKNNSDGNAVDPVETGETRKAVNAAAEDDPDRWRDTA